MAFKAFKFGRMRRFQRILFARTVAIETCSVFGYSCMDFIIGERGIFF
jgi:uncharacterized membrane-anchored protein